MSGGINHSNFVFLAMVSTLLVGCGPVASETGSTDAALQTSSVKVNTPLEVRDALKSLNIFGECFDPETFYDRNFGASATDGRAIFCQVLTAEEWQIRANTPRDRGVTAIFLRNDWKPVVENFCTLDVRNWSMVTDHETFFVYAQRKPTWGADGMWPEEVWPEDIQRVLGGQVSTGAELCDKAVGPQ